MVLTLDTRVQASLEKNMESMLEKFDAKNGGTGIVMEVNTGAIIAMASYPNFDPADYSAIRSEKLLASLNAEPWASSGATAASPTPTSPAPPSSPSPWRRRWRRAW